MEPALVEAGPVLGAGEALFSESSQSSREGKLVEPTPRPRVEGAKYKLAVGRGLKCVAEELERTSQIGIGAGP